VTDASEQFNIPRPVVEAYEIATAPGDLPPAEVEARLASRRAQFRHENTIVPLAPRPGEAVEVRATAGTGVRVERACVFYTLDGSLPDAAAPRVPLEAVSVEWEPLPGYLTHWRGRIPAQPAGTTVRYRIGGWSAPVQTGHEGQEGEDGPPDLWANDGQGFWFRFPGERGVTTFAYRVEPLGPALPAWARDAVIYQIFLDRFHPGAPDGRFPAAAGPNDRHGGTLEGVRRALPYLESLGVDCLWLSPISPSETYHRYDATDLNGVDPALGGGEALRALTQAAHARGMRVMLDFVPSHCSWHHPAFEAARRDPAAPTGSWFIFDHWPDRYRSFLQTTPSLPSFNTDDPGARAYIIDSAVHWLRDAGVDAFRLDHVIWPSMDFWAAFRAATRAAAPEVFTVGEATDTPDCLRRYRQRLDAVLDFPLARALRLAFAARTWDMGELDRFLAAYDRYMDAGPGRVSFLDNHDMNRFLFMAGGDTDSLKLAALCQFTLAPTPTIYYGTEVGLSQRRDIHDREADGVGGDAEARRDMPWDEGLWDHDLLGFYRTLIRLRRERAALRRGARHTVYLDAAAGAYAYVRSRVTATDEPDADLLIAFNVSDTEQTLLLPPGSGAGACLLSTGTPPEVWAADGRTSVTIAARTGAIMSLSRPR